MRSSVEETERKVIREHAAQWLLDLQEDAPERHREFCAWVRQSPRHVEEFLFAAAAWKALDKVGSTDPAEVDMAITRALAEAGADADNVVALKNAPKSQRQARLRHFRWAASFATLALIAAAMWGFLNLGDTSAYHTAIGEQRTVRLTDGSVLYLNTSSHAQVRFSGTERAIELLQGEALFVVAHDAARPFRVTAGKTIVQAVGTQFNINRRTTGTTVVVLREASGS